MSFDKIISNNLHKTLTEFINESNAEKRISKYKELLILLNIDTLEKYTGYSQDYSHGRRVGEGNNDYLNTLAGRIEALEKKLNIKPQPS